MEKDKVVSIRRTDKRKKVAEILDEAIARSDERSSEPQKKITAKGKRPIAVILVNDVSELPDLLDALSNGTQR